MSAHIYSSSSEADHETSMSWIGDPAQLLVGFVSCYTPIGPNQVHHYLVFPHRIVCLPTSPNNISILVAVETVSVQFVSCWIIYGARSSRASREIRFLCI